MTTQIRQQNGISILKPTGKVGGRSASDLRKVIKVSETKTQAFRFGIQSRPRVLDQSVVKTQDYFFSFFPIDKK